MTRDSSRTARIRTLSHPPRRLVSISVKTPGIDREPRRCNIMVLTMTKAHGYEPDLMANDPTRILVRQMMGAVAQYEKSQIVLKLRGARMRKRAKDGRCEGRKPYGYYDGDTEALERLKVL